MIALDFDGVIANYGDHTVTRLNPGLLALMLKAVGATVYYGDSPEDAQAAISVRKGRITMTSEDKAAEVLATVASFTAEYIQGRLLWQCGQMVPGADQNEPLRYALQQLHANPAEGLHHTLEGQEWHTMARYGAGLIDADAWEMREICQGMAEWLFAAPGSNTYTIPASWYDTPMGALWAMAIIRTEGDELVAIAEAARLAGVTVQAISQRIERGALQAFIDPFAPERQGRQKVRRRDVSPPA